MSIKKEGIVSVDVSKSDLTYQPWSGYCEPRAKPKKCAIRIGDMSEIVDPAYRSDSTDEQIKRITIIKFVN